MKSEKAGFAGYLLSSAASGLAWWRYGWVEGAILFLVLLAIGAYCAESSHYVIEFLERKEKEKKKEVLV
ncbi:MAG: hypothetical protein NUV78_03340 [Candidatus Zambryskibacteria bacterium]|nr:hypothetical protein [Candidatus Zambryskibacteria bacterium]